MFPVFCVPVNVFKNCPIEFTGDLILKSTPVTRTSPKVTELGSRRGKKGAELAFKKGSEAR